MMDVIARWLVLCGLIALCAGVWVLAGYGWALIVIGLATVFFGLVVIDVDKHKRTEGTGT